MWFPLKIWKYSYYLYLTSIDLKKNKKNLSNLFINALCFCSIVLFYLFQNFKCSLISVFIIILIFSIFLYKLIFIFSKMKICAWLFSFNIKINTKLLILKDKYPMFNCWWFFFLFFFYYKWCPYIYVKNNFIIFFSS